jgi:hypothetical protein
MKSGREKNSKKANILLKRNLKNSNSMVLKLFLAEKVR